MGYRKITGMGVEGSWLWEKILNDWGEGGTEKGKKGTSSEWTVRYPVVFFLRCCQDWNYSSSFCLLDSVHWATWNSALYLGSPQGVGRRHCKFLSDWRSSAHHLPDISSVGFATVLGIHQWLLWEGDQRFLCYMEIAIGLPASFCECFHQRSSLAFHYLWKI